MIHVGKEHSIMNVYRTQDGQCKPHKIRLNILSNGSLQRLSPASFNAVCRQLRHETSGMYWALNTFCGSADDLTFFLRHMRSKAQLLCAVKIIPSGYVMCPDRYHPRSSTLNYELASTLQRLRGLRRLEKVVVRLGLSDSREEDSVDRVVALSRHALEWVGGKQGLVVEVDRGH
jgi:hypothetical protein